MYEYVRYCKGTAVYKLYEKCPLLKWGRYLQVLRSDGKPILDEYENFVGVTREDLQDGRYVKVEAEEVEQRLGEYDMEKLYEWKDAFGQQKFGTKLATNSEGKWVMEVKGTSEVVSVDKYAVEEVIPHTIDIKFLVSSDRKYSYLAPKGKYNVGEVFVLENQNGVSFVTIVGVDTKASHAHKEFTPTSQLVTRPVDNTN